LFERPQSSVERAILVHVDFGLNGSGDDLEEFYMLAESAGAETVGVVQASRTSPDRRYYVGTGKLEDLQRLVEAESADVVLFNHALSPGQERNIERALKCRVLDRNGLILDIFAQRARSFEGKLQVELAQLRHLSTRLVRGWTHLERQKGGIGLRGPGETQLETDRRLLGARVKALRARLVKIETQRRQGRRARLKAEIPTLSLVGYTNAGKSTLFNRLTNAEVYAADQLFATLDPTLRQLELPRAGNAVMADTVGFIRHLPHELVAAFKATLLEAVEATLLLHVVDASNPDRMDIQEQVNIVLREIGAGEVPQLIVYNKCDLLADQPPRIDRDAEGRPTKVWLSAQTGSGCDLLLTALDELIGHDLVRRRVLLPASAGRLRARIYEIGRVTSERMTDVGDCELEVELQQMQLDRLQHDVDIIEMHVV
jgi:GTP-binding protein HflX